MPRQVLKRLKRSIIHKSPYLVVYKDSVRLPGGETGEYLLTQKSDIVVIVATTRHGEVIMLDEYKYAARGIMRVLPAGHIKGKESAVKTAKRELFEETGYGKGDFQYVGTLRESPVQDLHRVAIVRAKNVIKIGEPNHEVTEDIIIKCMRINEVKKAIKNGDIISCSTIGALCASGLLW